MSLHQSLFQALTVLGASADEVADQLAAWGFTGQRAVDHDCPVARYLKQELRRRDVTVGSRFCYVGKTTTFPLPAPVEEFLQRFDEEDKYLLLVDHAHDPTCPALPDHCTCA